MLWLCTQLPLYLAASLCSTVILPAVSQDASAPAFDFHLFSAKGFSFELLISVETRAGKEESKCGDG